METIDDRLAIVFYDYLKQTNPTIHYFNQLYYDNEYWKTWPNVLNSISGLDKKDHHSDYSLLFEGQTKDSIEYLDGKPNAFVNYRVIFTVARDENCRIITYTPKTQDHTDKNYADFDACRFFDEFFICSPKSVEMGQCDGKCQLDLSDNNTKIWCVCCHDDFENASNLESLLAKAIKFRRFPKESIRYIQKITTKIDFDNDLDLVRLVSGLESAKKKIDKIKYTIDSTDEDIVRYAEMRIAERKDKIRILQNVMSVHCIDSVECLTKSIDEVYLKINSIKDKREQNIIMMRRAKIQAEQNAKLAELQAEQDAVTIEYHKKINEIKKKMDSLN